MLQETLNICLQLSELTMAVSQCGGGLYPPPTDCSAENPQWPTPILYFFHLHPPSPIFRQDFFHSQYWFNVET